jgi:chemotaxis protein CheY-P-specific phosphatase CheC
MLNHISSKYEKLTPGIGTDIFIRKKAPGSQVGEGYIVDIYQNGVKTDSMEKNTKRETVELIQSFKDLYNTNRAFQNELQVHITYKTKEERGETAMLSIDQTLLKQASDIQNLLSRILDPEIPIVIRTAADPVDIATQPAPAGTADQAGLGNVTSVPSTPAPEGMQDNKAKIKKFMTDEIIKKFTTFVKKRYDEGRAEIDEIFNPLRSWYSKLKKEIERWNQMSEEKLSKEDITDVVKETSKILLSKDINIISKASGIQIDQNVADLIAQVSGRSVGKPGEAEKGGELGGNPEESKTKESTYKVVTGNIEEELYHFERQLQNSPTNPIPTLAKELGLDSKEKVQQLNEILSKKSNLTESLTAIKTWVDEEIQAGKKAEDKTKEFWRYASEFVGVANIDDVFFEWLGNSEQLSLEEVNHTWKKVNSDINSAFGSITESENFLNCIKQAVHSFFLKKEGSVKDIPDNVYYNDFINTIGNALPTAFEDTITSGAVKNVITDTLTHFVGGGGGTIGSFVEEIVSKSIDSYLKTYGRLNADAIKQSEAGALQYISEKVEEFKNSINNYWAKAIAQKISDLNLSDSYYKIIADLINKAWVSVKSLIGKTSISSIVDTVLSKKGNQDVESKTFEDYIPTIVSLSNNVLTEDQVVSYINQFKEKYPDKTPEDFYRWMTKDILPNLIVPSGTEESQPPSEGSSQ